MTSRVPASSVSPAACTTTTTYSAASSVAVSRSGPSQCSDGFLRGDMVTAGMEKASPPGLRGGVRSGGLRGTTLTGSLGGDALGGSVHRFLGRLAALGHV